MMNAANRIRACSQRLQCKRSGSAVIVETALPSNTPQYSLVPALRANGDKAGRGGLGFDFPDLAKLGRTSIPSFPGIHHHPSIHPSIFPDHHAMLSFCRILLDFMAASTSCLHGKIHDPV